MCHMILYINMYMFVCMCGCVYVYTDTHMLVPSVFPHGYDVFFFSCHFWYPKFGIQKKQKNVIQFYPGAF